MVNQYLEHSKKILSSKNSRYKPNRTGIDSISLFGHQNEYDLSEGFPLLTTKKMGMKNITHELIWFMSGSSNIKYLVDNNVPIWDDNAFDYYLKKQGLEDLYQTYSEEWNIAKKNYISKIKEDDEFAIENGDLGPVYGSQWRHWKTSGDKEIDQFGNIIESLNKSPMSRRLIVSAWNPEEISNMALPPCHTLFHLNAVDGQLDLQLYQRSCDMFLGVPYNIASYAMLTQILAKEADLKPGRFIHTFGDSHFYCGADKRGEWYGKNLDKLKREVKFCQGSEDYLHIKNWIEENAPPEPEGKEGQDHVTGILEQLTRTPNQCPKLEIAKKPFHELKYEDFKLTNYKSHDAIRRSMAV